MPVNKWKLTINVSDVFRNETLPFEQRRDAIVARIRASKWLKDDYWQLQEAVDNLAEAVDAEEFDGWWDEIYNLADRDRVWIDAIGRGGA